MNNVNPNNILVFLSYWLECNKIFYIVYLSSNEKKKKKKKKRSINNYKIMFLFIVI